MEISVEAGAEEGRGGGSEGEGSRRRGHARGGCRGPTAGSGGGGEGAASAVHPEYKLRIIEEADACRESGEIGALLRREGLYTSHLSIWREQRRAGALTVMGQPRGRKAKQSPVEKRLAQVERENAGLREELRQAHVIIAVPKKLSCLLGIPRTDPSDEER